MPASSNFQEAIREAQSGALVGPNVVNKALPYVGGGMVLTAGGVMGGLALMASNPAGFMPLFWVALIGNFVLFFVAQNVALKGNNSTALPLLTAYSLLTGFTLSGLVAMAIGTAGIGAIGTAALATGITFVAASVMGRRMSDSVGQALSGAVGLGILGLVIAMLVQIVGGLFVPGFGSGGFELLIAGFGLFWLFEHRTHAEHLPGDYLALRRALTLGVCTLLVLVAFASAEATAGSIQ